MVQEIKIPAHMIEPQQHYPIDPSDESRCLHCGSSWDQEEEHAKRCMIGEAALEATKRANTRLHPFDWDGVNPPPLHLQ